jgi:HEAT repeat protein
MSTSASGRWTGWRNLPLERARLALPEMIDLYRETGKAEQPLPRPDRNNDLRVEALRVVLRIGDQKVVPTLITLLSAPRDRQDFRLHQQAALGLASLPDPAAVPALARGLFLVQGARDTFEESRLALARIGPPAIPPLLALFGENEEDTRRAMRQRPIDVAPLLVRIRAAGLLGDLRAVPAIGPLGAALRPLRTASPSARELVRSLGLIGTARAVDPLLSVVRDTGADLELRVVAADAAALTGDEFVAPVLFDLVAGGPRDQPSPRLRARLLAPLARADKAAWALGLSGDRDAATAFAGCAGVRL